MERGFLPKDGVVLWVRVHQVYLGTSPIEPHHLYARTTTSAHRPRVFEIKRLWDLTMHSPR